MTGAPLQDAILDAAMLSQLLFDIEHAAELRGIVIRPLGARRAGLRSASHEPHPAQTLVEAQRVLADGTASVQLRYRFHDEEWWDTLLPVATGVRLVRISHTRALALGE